MPPDADPSVRGALDFLELFKPEAPWTRTAGKIQALKLPAEWLLNHAGDAEIQTAISGIQQRGMALAVEIGPLTPGEACGADLRGFLGPGEGLRLARRVLEAGGVIDLLALDAPYYYGHYYSGPGACRWTDEKIAREIAAFTRDMRGVFPNLRVGDTEPLRDPAGVSQYQAWMVAFKAVSGYNLAFLHLEPDWSRPNWPTEALEIGRFGAQRGVPVGMIFTGNPQDSSDQTWTAICGERIKRYEAETGSTPAHILFQSRQDKPDFTLPEDSPFTFTNLILTYFTDPLNLGFLSRGPGANLAYRKPVRFSQALPGFSGELAVDGDPGTFWDSGEGPVQWIEIDLGEVFTIRSIRLLLKQTGSGMAVHRVLGRSPQQDAAYTTLHTFSGLFDETTPLEFSPEQPWQGVRTLRIETLQSPAEIAWREIEIIDAGSPE